MGRRLAPVLIAFAAAGCASPPRVRPETVLVQSVLTSAATQVQRCYRAPRVASSGRQIITQLRVRVIPTGEIIGLPIVVRQTGVTPANQHYAQPMAEAAIGAVVRCAPLTLPARAYLHGWVEIDLTFSPLARA